MSGYIDCACRDCFEIAIGTAPALCHECERAGCDPEGAHECYSPSAYGGLEEDPGAWEDLGRIV